MKKIAFLWALVMIISCCFIFASCDDDSDKKSSKKESSSSVEDDAKEAVKYEIKAKLAAKSVSGDKYTFKSCTFSTVKEKKDGFYEMSGKVTVKDAYGDTLTATFDAEVEHEGGDDFDVDLDLGSFR